MVLGVRLTPKASRNAIGRVRRDGDGQLRLRVSVSAPPAENMANDALIELLAKAWKIPKSAMVLISGGRGREKRILIRGDAAPLKARIDSLLEGEND